MSGESRGLDRLKVLPYRAGYEEGDRQAVQERLTRGDLRGGISTSALELGLDISGDSRVKFSAARLIKDPVCLRFDRSLGAPRLPRPGRRPPGRRPRQASRWSPEAPCPPTGDSQTSRLTVGQDFLKVSV